jgi:TPP-dependent pyruvate/acetoin dehydrogenase alpha subunit
MDPEEKKMWLSKERDPISRFETRLLNEKIATQADLDELKARIHKTIQEAVAFAEQSPDPGPEVMYEDVYSN